MQNTHKGSITVEAIVMLGLIATLTPILYKHVAERRQDIENINEANTLLLLKNATAEYIEANKETLGVGATVLSPADIGVDISGYRIGIRKDSSGNIDAMIAASGGGNDMKAAKVAALLGLSAGIYSAQNTEKAWGINGVWAEDISNYGFSSLPAGVPVITTAYDKEGASGLNEEQLKEFIETTDFNKLSADEICLKGNCISEWADTTYEPIPTIINCNGGDSKACKKGFQKGINTSCKTIAETYQANEASAQTGFYTLATSESAFLYNQPCVFKDGEMAPPEEIINQCNSDLGSAACRYGWDKEINRSCEQIIMTNPSAVSGYYTITTASTATSQPCYFVGTRIATAEETILQCNEATTSSAMNSNIACRYGYVKGYNIDCNILIDNYPEGRAKTNSITSASGGNSKCCYCVCGDLDVQNAECKDFNGWGHVLSNVSMNYWNAVSFCNNLSMALKSRSYLKNIKMWGASGLLNPFSRGQWCWTTDISSNRGWLIYPGSTSTGWNQAGLSSLWYRFGDYNYYQIYALCGPK